ncbi:hypothetical protein CYMTET_54801 [Cymbomonas tetramitiformis]|uniref:Response regulatory domain-containing protein n=1 Tax=Cymbomonas tetramitiformis TaxID=36881 RepID=A0AAE0EQC7_9CHLO|nr:hypothetical protein CYMTET_54801 [Cymbomonas tetramitiformis]
MTVTQLLWQQAEEFGIRTELASPEIPDELEVSFDTNVLAIVMSNLVSNAHKYGGKDAHPSLVAEVLEQHQGTLRLSLWNSPGPNHGQFQRSNLQMLLSSAGNSGTFLSDGIGLTSIQKCMDCAGWTLELEIDSEGTTFVIYIPQAMHRPDTFLVDKHQQPLLMKTGNDPKHCQAQPHHPAVQLQPPEMSGASEQLNSGTAQSTNVLADMRVVVLDDSALVRRIYGHALKSMGVREWWVLGETREEILGFPKFVMAHAVDIIVLDQAFDEVLTRAECASVNGVTLLAELKQMGFKGFCATRTSHAEGNEKAYQESGFDAVLPKKGSLKQQLVENWQTWYKIQLNEQYIVNSSAMHGLALHFKYHSWEEAFWQQAVQDTQEMRCRGSLLTALAQCTVGGILASTELTLAGLITFGYFCWNKLLLCSHSKRVQWRWQQQSSILYMYMIWGIVEYVIVLRDPVGASAVTVVAKTTWAVMPLLSLGLSPGWWHVSWLQKSFATLLLTCVAACWQVMLVAQHDQRAAGDAAGNCASIRADEMLLRGGIMVLSAMLARRSERRRRLAFLAQALHQQQAADEHPGNHVFQNADGNIDELLQIPVVLSFIDQALEDSFRAHRLSACLPHARLCLIMLVASVYCSIARYIDVERAHSGLDLQCCMGALHLMAVVAWTRITATQQISMQAIGMGMMWVSQFIVLLLCVRQQQSLLLATDHSSTAAASFGLVYHLLGGVAGLCWVHVFIFGLMWHHGALCGAVGLVLHIACWGLQSGTPEDTKLLLGAPPTISSAVSASVLEERHRLLMGVTIGCVFVHALTCMLSHHVEELERESFRCHREQVSSSTDKASAKQGQQHDEHAGNQLERQEQQQESQQDQEDMLKDSSAMHGLALHFKYHSWEETFWQQAVQDTQEMRCRGSLLTALAQCTVGGILASTELTLAGLITFGYFCWNKLLLCSHSKRVQWRWQQQSSILYMYMTWGIVEYYVIVLRDPVGASAVTVVAKTTWAVMTLLSLGLSPGWWHVSWLQKSFATLLLTCVAACWQVMLVAQHDQRAAGDAAGNRASIRADEMLLRGGIMVLSAMLARWSERRRRLAFSTRRQLQYRKNVQHLQFLQASHSVVPGVIFMCHMDPSTAGAQPQFTYIAACSLKLSLASALLICATIPTTSSAES